LIEGIHEYAQDVSEKRTHILSTLPSKKYSGMSIAQEWMIDLFVEITHRFTVFEITHEEVEKWFNEYHSKNIYEYGYTGLPQYKNITDKADWAIKFVADIKKEFKLTGLVEIMMISTFMAYQSIIEGQDYISYPKLDVLKGKIAFFEELFYK
jgi:hypothetical protein